MKELENPSSWEGAAMEGASRCHSDNRMDQPSDKIPSGSRVPLFLCLSFVEVNTRSLFVIQKLNLKGIT